MFWTAKACCDVWDVDTSLVVVVVVGAAWWAWTKIGPELKTPLLQVSLRTQWRWKPRSGLREQCGTEVQSRAFGVGLSSSEW
jgi:hypothetical protein